MPLSELTASANITCFYEAGSESLHAAHLDKLSVQTPQVSRKIGGPTCPGPPWKSRAWSGWVGAVEEPGELGRGPC